MEFLNTIKRHKIISGIVAGAALLVIVIGTFAVTNKIGPVASGWWGPINEISGVALKGYDAIAYHQSNKAIPGSDSITSTWSGVTWHFATESNRNVFTSDPARYAPQYGGFCATAVSSGFTADIKPQAWQIVEGKLYVFNGKDPMASWVGEIPSGVISRGDENWATR